MQHARTLLSVVLPLALGVACAPGCSSNTVAAAIQDSGSSGLGDVIYPKKDAGKIHVDANLDAAMDTTIPFDAGTCFDGVKDGDETDIDCGGSCVACPVGEGCAKGTDCASGVCTAGKCAAPTCSDHVTNGSETATDCGGTCMPCANGSACLLGQDCTSKTCIYEVCVAPTCMDGFQDGTETGVDCGGSSCSPCPPGVSCLKSSDCTTQDCYQGFCEAPPSDAGKVDGGADAADRDAAGDGHVADAADDVKHG